jgi:hypothetical protein
MFAKLKGAINAEVERKEGVVFQEVVAATVHPTHKTC